MSARKLSRFAGLVFVLVSLVGGAAAATDASVAGDSIAATDTVVYYSLGDAVWT